MPFDLHRKRISAWSSGFAPEGEVDWSAADRGAEHCRELVALTAQLAELRASAAGSGAHGFGSTASPGGDGASAGGGVVAALERLREVGALPGHDGVYVQGVGERDLRLGLLEAAVACGDDTDPRSSRFLILDRRRAPVPDAELEALLSLTIGGSPEELRAEAERKRRELEGLRSGRAWTR
jgi:hypothetical protein